MSTNLIARVSFAALALALVTAPRAEAQELEARQAAAPPEDILSGRVRLPEPGAVRTLSRCALLPVELVPNGAGGWTFEAEVPLEVAGSASFVLAGREARAWTLSLAEPGGRPVDLGGDDPHAAVRRAGELSGPLRELAGERFDLTGVEPGAWRVRVESSVAPSRAPGFLLVAGGGELQLASHLTTVDRRSDRPVGIAACVLDGLETGRAPRVGLVADARLSVETEAGSFELAMLDDGRHADGRAGDGVFGALLPLGTSGPVEAHVTVRGVTEEGRPFLRGTRHAFTVVEPLVVLGGSASTEVLDEARLALDVGATLLAAPRLQVSAEVWGTDPSGTLVPVCWLSRILRPDPAALDAGGATSLRLVLDARWLNRAGASAPLELRRVRVQDPDTHVPYDRRRRIALAPAPVPSLVGRAPTAVEPGMLKSLVAPRSGIELATGTFVEIPTRLLARRLLMTTHGYCSSNVWGGGGFSDPRIDFLDLSQARTHDEFAQLLLAYGSAENALSYGIVAHSQGGSAALQLYAYYASGLDEAQGPRRIQSVGTPYQGTPLASFGGFTCGVVDDLTPDGAALWLAGIPTWARADVHYWTTSNSGSACNFLSDFFLSNPDDGVIEMARGQLPGGNSMGHTVGWCHSTGMSNPAHYTDSARNAEMDAQAAR